MSRSFDEFESYAKELSACRPTYEWRECRPKKRRKFFIAAAAEYDRFVVESGNPCPHPDQLKSQITKRLLGPSKNTVQFVPLWLALMIQFLLPVLIEWLFKQWQTNNAAPVDPH